MERREHQLRAEQTPRRYRPTGGNADEMGDLKDPVIKER